MSRDYPQMRIRLSPELREKIEKAAKAASRSMNAEIAHRLELSFDEEGDGGIETRPLRVISGLGSGERDYQQSAEELRQKIDDLLAELKKR